MNDRKIILAVIISITLLVTKAAIATAPLVHQQQQREAYAYTDRGATATNQSVLQFNNITTPLQENESLPMQEGSMLDDQAKQLIDESDQLINEFNNTERELPDEIMDTKREVKQQSDNGSELLVGKKKP
jgi:hypothetical protein